MKSEGKHFQEDLSNECMLSNSDMIEIEERQNTESGIAPLPLIMVAPNGAHRTKLDHRQIPLTIEELVETAKSCNSAGAGGMHAHVRDEQRQHVLDAGLYRELIAEIQSCLPSMLVQITTESDGRYSPSEQKKVVKDVMPKSASISLKELLSKDSPNEAVAFIRWAQEASVALQIILYDAQELTQFIEIIEQHKISDYLHQLLFVLGRYAKDQQSNPHQLTAFLEVLRQSSLQADWAVCAFGRSETECVQYAYAKGGKCRVGFENSLWNTDGSIAKNNAERVREVATLFEQSPHLQNSDYVPD